jgi:hypothetical protein
MIPAKPDKLETVSEPVCRTFQVVVLKRFKTRTFLQISPIKFCLFAALGLMCSGMKSAQEAKPFLL